MEKKTLNGRRVGTSATSFQLAISSKSCAARCLFSRKFTPVVNICVPACAQPYAVLCTYVFDQQLMIQSCLVMARSSVA